MLRQTLSPHSFIYINECGGRVYLSIYICYIYIYAIYIYIYAIYAHLYVYKLMWRQSLPQHVYIYIYIYIHIYINIHNSSSFKNQIKNETKLLIAADKTTNFYKLEPSAYNDLLEQNITKSYKKAQPDTVQAIHAENKNITTSLFLLGSSQSALGLGCE